MLRDEACCNQLSSPREAENFIRGAIEHCKKSSARAAGKKESSPIDEIVQESSPLKLLFGRNNLILMCCCGCFCQLVDVGFGVFELISMLLMDRKRQATTPISRLFLDGLECQIAPISKPLAGLEWEWEWRRFQASWWIGTTNNTPFFESIFDAPKDT
jgi:hypothetical protein